MDKNRFIQTKIVVLMIFYIRPKSTGNKNWARGHPKDKMYWNPPGEPKKMESHRNHIII